MVTQRELQAEVTRERILDAAAAEIYRVGFQAAALGDILKALAISKGALYHHFSSKLELGYAVLDEHIAPRSIAMWDAVLAQPHVLDGLCTMLEGGTDRAGELLNCGCPINNLAQEMSPLDEGFRQRIERIYAGWHRRLHNALAGAQQRGEMCPDSDASEVAYFIIAALQGAIGLAKNSQDCGIFRSSIKTLSHYLRSLKSIEI